MMMKELMLSDPNAWAAYMTIINMIIGFLEICLVVTAIVSVFIILAMCWEMVKHVASKIDGYYEQSNTDDPEPY